MVEVKSGTIEDFFRSAKSTAKEIDNGKKVTQKHRIWVDINDMNELIKPQRTKLLRLLREKRKMTFSDIRKELHKSPASLNKDIELLAKYQLVNVYKIINPGHGMKKMVEASFLDEEIEFKATL